MKSRFALDLTNEAIRLLERCDEGWAEIGSAELTDPRLDRRLADLRGRAEARAPDGFCSKLILPNSQILYLTVEAPGPDTQTRRAQIRAALQGLTPYAVDELVFDWSGNGASVRVAVLAGITLQEAETFAEAYGFRPVAFVAVPEDGRFGGEPFFGLTSMVARHLPAGVRYDRDQDPVRLAASPDPEALADLPETEGDTGVVGVATGADQATPVTGDNTPPGAIAVAIDDAPGFDDTEPAFAYPTESAPTHDAVASGDIPGDSTDLQDRPAQKLAPDQGSDAEVPEADGPLQPNTVTDISDEAGQKNSDVDAPFVAIEDDSPDLAGIDAPLLSNPIAVTDGSIPEADPEQGAAIDIEDHDTAPDSDAAPIQTFQSRRNPDQAGHEGERIAAIAARLGGRGPNSLAAATRSTEPRPRLTVTSARPVDRPAGAAGDQLAERASLGRLQATMVEFRSIAGQAAQSARRAGAEGLHRIADRLPRRAEARPSAPDHTIFGAPRTERAGTRSIWIGGAIAAALVAATVGFWSLVFWQADAPTTGRSDPQPAAAEQVTAQAPATPADPAATSTPTTDVQDFSTELAEPGVEVAAPLPPIAAESEPGMAVGEIAAEEPPVASDPALLPSESLAGDPPLPSQPLPQPFGTTFTYDTDGLIAPTPQGSVTPGGFTLFAGRPSLAPPARPAPPPDPGPPGPTVDDRVQGKQPQARPEGLVPPAPAGGALAGAAEGAVVPPGPLPPPADPRHAAQQPKPRPAKILTAAQTAQENAASIAAAAEAAARAEAEAFEADLRGATPQAVASSQRPASRPNKIAALAASAAAVVPVVDGSAVEAALAEAQQSPTAPEPVVQQQPAAPEPVTQKAAAPEPPPEELDEPEPDEGIATLPTTRTVAKKSTIANAIDLGDVNLIGVYGSSANRRALVRMPSGRYVKVQVGDRLDGGKVAAIGDNELSYVKRGQTIVLKILKKG